MGPVICFDFSFSYQDDPKHHTRIFDHSTMSVVSLMLAILCGVTPSKINMEPENDDFQKALGSIFRFHVSLRRG